MRRVQRQRVGLRHAGQQPTREPVGQRRLADAVGPGDQPGMVHTPGPQCLDQRGLGWLVAEQDGVGAWFRCHPRVIADGWAETAHDYSRVLLSMYGRAAFRR